MAALVHGLCESRSIVQWIAGGVRAPMITKMIIRYRLDVGETENRWSQVAANLKLWGRYILPGKIDLVPFVRPGTTIQCAGTLTINRRNKVSKVCSALDIASRAVFEKKGKYR